MSVVNRFAQLQKEKPQSRPKRQKQEEPEPESEAAGESSKAHHQQGKGGWQVVEPRKKPQPTPAKPSDGATQQRKKSPKIKREPDPKPPEGQPIGATLVDPAVLKAQKKAAQALQRHYAKQQAPQREPRDSDNDEAMNAVSRGKQKVDAVSAWLGPELPTATGGKQQHRDPNSHQAIHFVKNHAPQGAKKGSVWASEPAAQATGGPKQPKQKQSAPGGKKATDSAPQGPIKAPESAKIHEHLDDGSVIADVSFQFVIQNVTNKGCRTVPLVVAGKDGPSLNPKALDLFAKAPKVVKGGFFISAEQKSWSNESTVDEPWMIDSYFKALIPILKKEASSAVAYPFWPKEEGGAATSDVEAKVMMRVVPGHTTALELEHEEHHCSIKVMTRRAKVSLRHFAQRLVEEAEMLLKFIAAVTPQLQGSETLKAFPNAERLLAHLDECRALLAS
jgi:hypothetical protein